MNISLTGTLGSGKSSVCKILEKQGYSTISNGILFRQIAQEKGISVVELNKLAETDKSIDKMLDERSIQLGKERDQTIFDSRMGWHFIPDSFKVFLMTNMDEAANRVFHDHRVSENYESVEEAKKDLLRRQLLEKERFSTLYGVDYLDLNNYDLVIETTSVSPELVAQTILDTMKAASSGEKHILLNPTSLYPTKSTKEFSVENESATAQVDLQSHSVEVAIIGNRFCIADGHERVIDCIQQKENFLPVKFVKSNNLSAPVESQIHEFETVGNFTYKLYPDFSEKNFLQV